MNSSLFYLTLGLRLKTNYKMQQELIEVLQKSFLENQTNSKISCAQQSNRAPMYLSSREKTPKNRLVVYTDGSCCKLPNEESLAGFSIYFPDIQKK